MSFSERFGKHVSSAFDTTDAPAIPATLAANLCTDFQLTTLCEALHPDDISSTQTVTMSGNKKLNFKLVQRWYDEKTGAKVFGFREVNTSGELIDELRLIFPGRSHGIKGTLKWLRGTKAENDCAMRLLNGEQSTQIAATEQYVRNELIGYLKKHPNISVHIFGHSMGSGNALAAKHLLTQPCKNISTIDALIYEPFAAAHAIHGIIERMPCDPHLGPQVHKVKMAEAINNLREGVVSVSVDRPTLVTSLQCGDSSMGNKPFADQAFTLSLTDHPHLAGRFTGAAFGALAGAMASVAMNKNKPGEDPDSQNIAILKKINGKVIRTVFAGAACGALGAQTGASLDQVFNQSSHLLNEPLHILIKNDRQILKPSGNRILPADNDEIIEPPHDLISPSDNAVRTMQKAVWSALTFDLHRQAAASQPL